MSSQEWVDRELYAELGVSPDASTYKIKRAYRKLARENHPDANPGNTAAEAKFKAVSEAYAALSAPDKRKQYDEIRHLAASGVGAAGFGSRTGRTITAEFNLGNLFGTWGNGMGLLDAEALFAHLFGNPTSHRNSAPPYVVGRCRCS